MSIGVQSYPELFTMLMGWNLYDKLWGLLTETGIAYLPFIGMLLKNVSKSYVMHGNHGAQHALRSMELTLITTLLLIFFGASPALLLDPKTVTYSPICGNKGNVYAGETGTTYDEGFTIPNPSGGIRVPLWWYAVIAVSEGTTNAANTFVDCVPDYRKMMTVINTARISDPEVKEEMRDFESMCYAPAKTQYLNDTTSGNETNLIKVRLNTEKYGVEDTEWFGSHAFAATYYRNLTATRPVSGFPYDPTLDLNVDTSKMTPAYGLPTCYDWWMDPEHGLRKRVFDALPDNVKETSFFGLIKDEKGQDDVVKKIITNNTIPNAYGNANNLISDNSYSHAIAALGIWYHGLNAYPKIYAASQAAPIIQVLLLMMVYVFLPFALVFGGYSPTTFVRATFVIFSLIFWTFIWNLVGWIDHALISSLYENWVTQIGSGAMLTDMIIGTFVVVAPIFWFSVMTALGIGASDMVGSAVGSLNKTGENAAGEGSELAEKTGGIAIKAAAL